jgi:hypothetical protein
MRLRMMPQQLPQDDVAMLVRNLPDNFIISNLSHLIPLVSLLWQQNHSTRQDTYTAARPLKRNE